MSLDKLLSSNEPQGLELKLEKLAAGVASALPAGKTLDVGGTTYTVDALVAKASEMKAFFTKPREARLALRDMVADRKRIAPETAAFLNNVRNALSNALGPSSSADLAKLGFPPRKPRRPLTAEEKVLRAAKAKLTREMRHTLGPVQKDPIRAEGTPVVTVGSSGGTTVVPAVEASASADAGSVATPGSASVSPAATSPPSPKP